MVALSVATLSGGLSLFAPPQLHIPDGFLSLPIAIVCWGITIGLIAIAVRRTQAELGERQVPLMGIMAAFIFAAQMINFPVAGGTSGHLLGGTLAAIALGPWAAMLVMAAVIGVQGLIFQDGGLLAMGANILNMGLLTALISYGPYRSVAERSRGVRLAVAGVVAWLAVMAAALATSLQLWLSGTSQLNVVVPAMLGVHALIGVGEALITVAALAFILQTRPDLLAPEQYSRGGGPWLDHRGLHRRTGRRAALAPGLSQPGRSGAGGRGSGLPRPWSGPALRRYPGLFNPVSWRDSALDDRCRRGRPAHRCRACAGDRPRAEPPLTHHLIPNTHLYAEIRRAAGCLPPEKPF